MSTRFAAMLALTWVVFSFESVEVEHTLQGTGTRRLPRGFLEVMAGVSIYTATVRIPLPIRAAAQIRSRLIHARRTRPTPSFVNTIQAAAAVTTRYPAP